MVGTEVARLKICVLASGSRGNSIFVGCPGTRVLLDAGLAATDIAERMALIGERPEELDAVILTHEHTDHVQGAGVISRRHGVPIYVNPMTFEAASAGLGKLERVTFFETGQGIHINGLQIEPFSLPHDARDPVGFVLKWEGRKVSAVTDLGSITHLVREKSEGSDLLILEFNHDPGMLIEGPYPWSLKQRIKSRLGHLSNEESAKLLRQVAHGDLRHVFLAHISEHNNHPELALLKAAGALRGYRASLGLTFQDRISETVYL